MAPTRLFTGNNWLQAPYPAKLEHQYPRQHQLTSVFERSARVSQESTSFAFKAPDPDVNARFRPDKPSVQNFGLSQANSAFKILSRSSSSDLHFAVNSSKSVQ